jgi:hypothetical protein
MQAWEPRCLLEQAPVRREPVGRMDSDADWRQVVKRRRALRVVGAFPHSLGTLHRLVMRADAPGVEWREQEKPCGRCGSLILVDPITIPICVDCFEALEAERRAGAVCIGCGEAGTIEYGYDVFVCEGCLGEAKRWGTEPDGAGGRRIRPRPGRRRRCLVCHALSFTPSVVCDECVPKVEARGLWSLVRQEDVPAGRFRCLRCKEVQPIDVFRDSPWGECADCRSWY